MPFRGPGDDHLPRLRRRRGMGRPGLRPGDGPPLRERERDGLDFEPGETTGGRRPAALSAALRQLPQRHLAGAPPQIPSLLTLGAARRRGDHDRVTGRRRTDARVPEPRRDEMRPLSSPEDGSKTRTSSRPRAARPYRFTGYHKFLDPDGYPAVAPPWGTLNAINLSTGEYAWQVPLGRISGARRAGPEGHRQRELRGAGGHRGRAGLHCRDELRPEVPRLRQGDRRAALGDHAAVLRDATPAIYAVGGRQFVVVAGRRRQGAATQGRFIAFALPPPPR